MDVKDLAGISTPITRLIEVISAGVGQVSRSYFTRLQAHADVEAIKLISSAIDGLDQSTDFTYKKDAIEIRRSPNEKPSNTQALASPAETRIEYIEAKRQRNVEQITSNAALALSGIETVNSDLPSEDWISRFFREAEDVTSEQMQILWGKVLAGEVINPGSFSLRTLDVLRSLSAQEAKLVERLAKYVIRGAGLAFIPASRLNCLHASRELLHGELVVLSELGLLQFDPLDVRLLSDSLLSTTLVNGEWLANLERERDGTDVRLSIMKITQVGSDLVSLVSTEGSKIHLIESITTLLNDTTTARIAKGHLGPDGLNYVVDQSTVEFVRRPT